MADEKRPYDSFWKASPKLRRFAQQQVQDEGDWRGDMARQNAAVQYALPEKDGSTGLPRTRTTRRAGSTGLPQARMNVFLRLNRAEQDADVEHITLEIGGEERVEVLAKGGIGMASLTEGQLERVLDLPEVGSADMAEPVKRPLVLVSTSPAGQPVAEPTPRRVDREELHAGGKGVLVGIIDVEGFDFAHADFIDPATNKTRFVRIWDQAPRPPSEENANRRRGPVFRGKEQYGIELDGDTLNRAIERSQGVGIAPYHIAAQSSMVPGSHGTHVASIAAGRAGVAPNADIAAVLIYLPDEDWDRRASFTDSTRIADAVEYLLHVKEQEGYEALSINISLGTNGHAHDGTSGACRWIESALDRQGLSVCIAVGNAGQEAPETVDDLGFIVGRIHTSGQVAAAGLNKDIHLEVAGFPIEDVSENEIEIWHSPQDQIAVSVRPPGGQWIGPVEPGQDHAAAARDSVGGSLHTSVSIFNDLYRPENGSNHISVFLTPPQEPPAGVPRRVHPGIWALRLHGREIRDGRYDGWIERDDPIPVQGLTPQRQWHYPAFFAGESNVDRKSLSSLACTRTAVAVANMDAAAERVAVTSSQGPTRDGQRKPEVCAPGTYINAASGFHPHAEWVRMSGTSMASPYVAGVAALMLAVEPSLTPAQIRGIMVRTTQPLPGHNYDWRDDAGFGQLRPDHCIREVEALRNAIQRGNP
jgi:subtilisin family serine protease